MTPSWEIRLEIFNKWQSGETQKNLAQEYGVSLSRVSQICQNTKVRVDLKGDLEPDSNKKRAPGRPFKSDEPTQKISVRLPKNLLKLLDSLPGDRTSNLTQIISSHFKNS